MVRQGLRGASRRPLRRLGLGVLAALGLAFVAVQSAPSVRDMLNPVRAAANDRLVGNANPSLFSRLTGAGAKDQRIRDLEAEVRDLARWRAAALSMAERMETYEDILNLMGEPPARGVTARVAAETDGPFSETLLANAGADQGVEPGFIAVNEGGLVGRVVRLGQRSSRILLVKDFNSRVPVLGEASGVRAIMYGGRDGLGVLTDRPEQDDFVDGERILTSGEGGLFPRGIVAGIALQDGDAWRVALAMDAGDTGFVRLLPPFSIPAPEEEPVADEIAPTDTSVAGLTARQR
ncbi:MAG: rod shape-determining protein MreC [Pseudomonadota bacterium]